MEVDAIDYHRFAEGKHCRPCTFKLTLLKNLQGDTGAVFLQTTHDALDRRPPGDETALYITSLPNEILAPHDCCLFDVTGSNGEQIDPANTISPSAFLYTAASELTTPSGDLNSPETPYDMGKELWWPSFASPDTQQLPGNTFQIFDTLAASYNTCNEMKWPGNEDPHRSTSCCPGTPTETLPQVDFRRSAPGVDIHDAMLSRPIFGRSSSLVKSLTEGDTSTWPISQSLEHASTVAPEATYQPIDQSSSFSKFELITPNTGSETGAHPRGSGSTEADRFRCDIRRRCRPKEAIVPDSVRDDGNVKRCAESTRRTRTRSAAKKTGMHCDAVIPSNPFKCRIPGCTKGRGGQPSSFKRQEHMKRHERSVHRKPTYFCWVDGCLAAFSRSDNRNTHLKKTHGKNSPAQRNRYVATLDELSPFFNQEYDGPLTADGYPIRDPRVNKLRCPTGDCKLVFHQASKLKSCDHGERQNKRPRASRRSQIEEEVELEDEEDLYL